MTPDLPALPAPAPPPAPARRPLVEAWLEGMAPATRTAYLRDLDDFGRWLGSDPPAAAVDGFLQLDAGRAQEVALGYRNALLARGLSSATVGRRLAALKSLVKLARQLGRVAWAVEVAKPRPEPREDREGPDDAARRKLWRAARKGDAPRDRRDRAVLALLFDLALRRHEVTGLAMEDLDLRRGTVAVKRKGKREKVRLKLPAPTRRDLEAWVAVRGTQPGAVFTRTDRDPGPDAPAISGEAVRLLVARAGKAAGLDGPLRPHGLRHAAITRGADLRKSLPELKDFGGHSKVETTMGYVDRPGSRAFDVADAVAKERK